MNRLLQFLTRSRFFLLALFLSACLHALLVVLALPFTSTPRETPPQLELDTIELSASPQEDPTAPSTVTGTVPQPSTTSPVPIPPPTGTVPPPPPPLTGSVPIPTGSVPIASTPPPGTVPLPSGSVPTALTPPPTPTGTDPVKMGTDPAKMGTDPAPNTEKIQHSPTLRSKIRIEKLYPRSAQLRGEEGTVRIRAFIDAEGRVQKTEILQSSTFTSLDEAARKAVLRAQFAPAQEDGHAISGTVIIPFVFRLHE